MKCQQAREANKMKITELTKEQEEYLPVFRQKYLDIACNGKRISREKLETSLEKAYKIIGKEKPMLIILESPQQAMMAIKLIENIKGRQLSDQLNGQLWNQLRDQLSGQLRGQLNGQLWNQLREQLRRQLWDQIGGQLSGQLRGQLRNQLWNQLNGQPIYSSNYLYGTQDLYWIAWGRFAQYIGVDIEKETQEKLNIMENISTQCEWWWPYESICFVSEKPIEINWNEDRLLHAENKPAVLYSDGYSIYSWRGINVPKKWIEGEGLTAKEALTWDNIEQRRAACEILGWDTILDELDAKTIEQDNDPQIGELIEVEIPDIGKERFLRVTCGTGRRFALPVPPDMKTALQANAWTYNIPEDLFKPEFRT